MRNSTSGVGPNIKNLKDFSIKPEDPDYPIFEAGIKEGKRLMQSAALGFLEKEYLDDAIERGSAKGEAILGLTRALSAFLKKQ